MSIEVYIIQNGRKVGPFDLDRLAALISAGDVHPAETVQIVGTEQTESASALLKRHGRNLASNEVQPSVPPLPPQQPPPQFESGQVSNISRTAYVLVGLLPGIFCSLFGINNLMASHSAQGVIQLVLSLLAWVFWILSIAGLPPLIIVAGLMWIGLLIWTIIEVSSITTDGMNRRMP